MPGAASSSTWAPESISEFRPFLRVNDDSLRLIEELDGMWSMLLVGEADTGDPPTIVSKPGSGVGMGVFESTEAPDVALPNGTGVTVVSVSTFTLGGALGGFHGSDDASNTVLSGDPEVSGLAVRLCTTLMVPRLRRLWSGGGVDGVEGALTRTWGGTGTYP